MVTNWKLKSEAFAMPNDENSMSILRDTKLHRTKQAGRKRIVCPALSVDPTNFSLDELEALVFLTERDSWDVLDQISLR
jgi:hypothetical protein